MINNNIRLNEPTKLLPFLRCMVLNCIEVMRSNDEERIEDIFFSVPTTVYVYDVNNNGKK